jgi:hypothetical protein
LEVPPNYFAWGALYDATAPERHQDGASHHKNHQEEKHAQYDTDFGVRFLPCRFVGASEVFQVHRKQKFIVMFFWRETPEE